MTHRYQDTSREALSLFAPVRLTVNAKILGALAERGPLASIEMQESLKLKHQTCSAQISHMADDGWLMDSGERVELHGTRHIKWTITPPGRVQLERYEAKAARRKKEAA